MAKYKYAAMTGKSSVSCYGFVPTWLEMAQLSLLSGSHQDVTERILVGERVNHCITFDATLHQRLNGHFWQLLKQLGLSSLLTL